MKHFTLQQRYALKAYLECGKTKNEVANLLGIDKSRKRSVKGKRLDAGWDNEYLLKTLKN